MNTKRIVDFALAKNGSLPDGYRISFIDTTPKGM